MFSAKYAIFPSGKCVLGFRFAFGVLDWGRKLKAGLGLNPFWVFNPERV
jgi:hypothetical protein